MTELQIAKLYLATNSTATAAQIDTAVTTDLVATTATITALSAADFLEAAYQAAFGRSVDAEGAAYWANEMTNGMTQTQVVDALPAGAAAYVAPTAENPLVIGDVTFTAAQVGVSAANDVVVAANKAAIEATTTGISAGSAAVIVVDVTEEAATVTAANSAVVVAVELAEAAALVAAEEADVAAYDAALVTYNAAVATAAASKLIADNAALTVGTVDLAAASKAAALTAQTDATASVTAVDALIVAAAATDATLDDTTAAANKVLADATLTLANALVTTATTALTDAQAAELASASVGETFTLTTARDILTPLTDKSDTVTGVYGTVQGTDIIVDTSVVDSDVANLIINSGTQVTLSNIETVNIDLKDGVSVDATNFSGVKTLNVDSNFGFDAFTVDQLTSGMTVGFDSTINTTGTVLVDMYHVDGTDVHTDALTVSFAGGVIASLDKDNGNQDVDALTINSTGSSVNTISLIANDVYQDTTAAANSIDLTGDQDLVIVVDQVAGGATGLENATVTNNMTGDATAILDIASALVAGTTDYTAVAVDKILLSTTATGATSTLQVMDGTTIETNMDNAINAGALTIETAVSGGTLNYHANNADTASAGLVFAEAGTVNLSNTSALAVITAEAMTTTYVGAGNSTDVNIAIGEGLTIASLAATAGSVTDAVVVTGTGDKLFQTTAAATTAMNSLSVTTEGTVTLEEVTAAESVSITTTEEVSLQEIIGTVAGTTTLTVDAGKTVDLNDALGATALGDISITAGTTVTVVAAATIDNSGALEITSGTSYDTDDAADITTTGNVAITAGTTIDSDGIIASTTGNIGITATESIILTGTTSAAIDADIGDITIEAGTSFLSTGTATSDIIADLGNVTITAGTSFSTIGGTTSDIAATAGNVSITAGTTIVTSAASTIDAGAAIEMTAGQTVTIASVVTAATDLSITGTSLNQDAALVGTGSVTLTGSTTTLATATDLGAHITGAEIVLAGSGHTYVDSAAINLTGNVTMNAGVIATLNDATTVITGTLTKSGAGAVTVAQLNGNLIADTATDAITLSATGANVTSIVSGSGNDDITTGNVQAIITTGAGNDTIDAALVTTTSNQVNIDGGAGNDSITGGQGASDILTGGTGTDTFILLDSDYAGATEKITDFEVGASGDVFSIDGSEVDTDGTSGAIAASGLTSDGATVTMVDTTDATTTANTDTHIYVMTEKSFVDEDAMIAGMNDAVSGITGAGAADAVLVAWSDTDGHSYITAVEDDTGASEWDNATEQTLVQLSGLSYTDLAGLTSDNFTVA